MQSSAADFVDHFSSISEPWISRSRVHDLIDILFISVAGTLAGCDGPTDIANFAETQRDWCKKFVRLKNGVPSHDTIGRVISLIKPEQFQKAFLDWIAEFTKSDDTTGTKLIPIDGKTLRGSGGSKTREKPLHVVSAWATEQGISLGQVAVDSKSNEITAIPKLLEMLELKGAIVSIDAMGCQKDIAKKIVDHQGDYVLAVKRNHPTFADAICKFFLERHEHEDFSKHHCRQHHTTEKARGGIENRYYVVAPLPDNMKKFCRNWKDLKTIGHAITTTTTSDGKETSEVRNFIQQSPAESP